MNTLRRSGGVLLLFLLLSSGRASVQTTLLDGFETLGGWEAIHSHGDAARIAISETEGQTGKALRIDFSFIGYMGSVSIQKRLRQPLPAHYQLSFDIRGEAPLNNLVVRLKDSIDNVWWVNRTSFDFPRTWTKVGIKEHQIQYGWGPSLGGEIRTLDRIEIMIDVVEGGTGTVWIDNLMLEAATDTPSTIPVVSASSARIPGTPKVGADGRTLAGWHSAGFSGKEWLMIDFGGAHTLGGLVIDWDSSDYPASFDLLLSDDGKSWRTSSSVTGAAGTRSFIGLNNGEGRFLKLDLKESRPGKGFGIVTIELKGPDFTFSPNEFFTSVAGYSPRGFYPKYLYRQQSYWTVAGVPSDTKEALINEQGMIETDKLSFSLDPFLYVDDTLVTWNDVELSQSLEKQYLPIPSVHWNHRGELGLTVTALASGSEATSVLNARYLVENNGRERRKGRLFVAVRPFQVNPPWQTFTIVGGTATIDSILCADVVQVNRKIVVPLSRPTAVGCATFDQGHVTDYLREGKVPPFRNAFDPSGLASAALQYEFDLKGGESREVIIVVPFHERPAALLPSVSDEAARTYFRMAMQEITTLWESRLNRVDIRLPPSAAPIVNTIKSNIGYVLINADGVATQPGSRSYERSWLRDGSLTSTAFLQMGITDEVRRYLDWYARYQYPDGKIPAVVESRGPEPTPEHDSHGQFIYAVLQYFRFTHDTTWLREKWENVARTVRYIQALRAERKTDVYRSGTPEQRACFGLVPESISHEGYSWKPQHSYWDNFFVIRGLKDAATIAEILGKKKEEQEFVAERDDFRKDFYGSIRLAMQLKNVNFIPGCVELGDFSGLSTTIGITPCDELGWIPEPALTFTFDESYRQFLERKNNALPWDAYLPYDARFIGAYVFLDRKDRANEILSYLMRDRRPPEWNHWAEVVWKDRDAPKSIGDMPHSWAASDFIRSVRSMLVYERERDEALVVGAGIPEAWLDDPDGVKVRGLPTYYGRLNYAIRKAPGWIVVELSGDLVVPPGNIIVKSPLDLPLRSVRGDGSAQPGDREVRVERLPARLELVY